ncbi:MAG: endonuclease/exonuclease/phosphatase family protein [Acidobacteriota bacterium]
MSTIEKSAVPSFIAAAKTEQGDFRSVAISAAHPEKLVIASYNIRYAVGQFLISSGLLRKAGFNPPQPRTDRVGEHIRLAARAFSDGVLLPPVDILALQEADNGTARTGGHHVARDLAEAMRMYWVHVGAGIPRDIKPVSRQWWLNFEEQIGRNDPGDTGVAMLSRQKLNDVKRVDLPYEECPWRPRLAMAATVAIGSVKLRVINAHVDPHAAIGGQLKQVEALLEHAARNDGPTLILGDFNTLSKRKVAETRDVLEANGYFTPFPSGTATWRGAGLRLHADWIFGRHVKFTRYGVARPLNVSDHWPIWAEVAIAD